MRRFLVIGLIICAGLATSGCSSDSGHGSYDKTVTVDEDQYFSVQLTGVSQVGWIVEYLDGEHNFDVYLLDDVNYQQFTNGNSFNYLSELSAPDAKGGQRGPVTITEDDYYLVVDNSNQGDSAPPSDGVNNPVRVRTQIEYS